METPDALLAFAALGHPSRLEVYRLLVRRGPEGYTPGELASRLALSPATLSFHLKALRDAGLIAMQRSGRHLHYSPDFARMQDLVGFLTDNCCSLGSTAGADCCAPSVSPTAVLSPARRRA